jgi:hypothetical protein
MQTFLDKKSIPHTLDTLVMTVTAMLALMTVERVAGFSFFEFF